MSQSSQKVSRHQKWQSIIEISFLNSVNRQFVRIILSKSKIATFSISNANKNHLTSSVFSPFLPFFLFISFFLFFVFVFSNSVHQTGSKIGNCGAWMFHSTGRLKPVFHSKVLKLFINTIGTTVGFDTHQIWTHQIARCVNNSGILTKTKKRQMSPHKTNDS